MSRTVAWQEGRRRGRHAGELCVIVLSGQGAVACVLFSMCFFVSNSTDSCHRVPVKFSIVSCKVCGRTCFGSYVCVCLVGYEECCGCCGVRQRECEVLQHAEGGLCVLRWLG